MPPRAARRAGQALASGLLLATTALSLSRIAALRLNYGAPMRVYSALPQVGITHMMRSLQFQDVTPNSSVLRGRQADRQASKNLLCIGRCSPRSGQFPSA